MNAAIDVKTEMRKIVSSKPVHAAAGAGVLATQRLRELPSRLARWRSEASVTTLSGRASDYVATARTRASSEYDKLALHGKRVLDSRLSVNGGGAAEKRRSR